MATDTTAGSPLDGASHRTSDDLKALIHKSDMVIVGIDLDANITSWNTGAERLLGYSSNEMIGTEYAALLPTDLRGELNKCLGKVRRGRSVPEVETRRLRKDGSIVDVVFSIYATHAADEIVGAVTVVHDITGRKKIEQELKESTVRIQSIVNTIVDGLITIDAIGTINAFNPGASVIFQYRAHEVIGHNIRMLMPEPYQSEHDGYLQNYKETRQPKVIGRGREVVGLRKDGTTFPMDLAVSEMKLASGVGYVGTVRDVTERRDAELALREQMDKVEQANEELECSNDELATTNDALAESNQLLRDIQGQLVEAEKMASLGSLVAGVAHEINTPLGIGLSAVSHFQDQVRALSVDLAEGKLKKSSLDSFCATSNEAAEMIASNLRRAADLIKSFKQVAVDQTSSEKRDFILGAYLTELMSSLSPVFRKSPVTVTLECPDNIQMDSYPGPLSQVVTNLITNALTHAFDEGQAGAVVVHVTESGPDVILVCSDNGRGIPEEHQSKVFDPFFTTRRNKGGTGLGLSVTYNLIVQTLRGKVTMTSKLGEGTVFTVRLPRDVAVSMFQA
jgi:PAS domain S-box-containing protein